MRYCDFGRTGWKVSEIALTGFERHPRTRVQLVSNKDDLAAETLGPERATDADVAGGDIVDAGGRASKTSPTRAPCIHVGAESFLIKNHQFRARCVLDLWRTVASAGGHVCRGSKRLQENR
jgi:hypothetical protein